MSTTMTQPVRSLARRPAVKVALVGALLLLLLLPSAWVDGLIGEREARQADVRNEIARG